MGNFSVTHINPRNFAVIQIAGSSGSRWTLWNRLKALFITQDSKVIITEDNKILVKEST